MVKRERENLETRMNMKCSDMSWCFEWVSAERRPMMRSEIGGCCLEEGMTAEKCSARLPRGPPSAEERL